MATAQTTEKDHELVKVYGVPSKKREDGYWESDPEGLTSEGAIVGPLPRGRGQIVGLPVTGEAIQRGFSGAGVYDPNQNAVVGMIVEADPDTKKKVSRFVDAQSLNSAVAGGEVPDPNFVEKRPGGDGSPARRVPVESGALHPSSPFYVRRPSDTIAENCLDEAERTTIIRGPQQIGKSSLLARLHARAQALGRKSYYVDFRLVNGRHLHDLDHLFRYLARQMQRALGIATDPRKVWDEYGDATANMTEYLEDFILKPAKTPVHVIFDEADRLFVVPYRDDFFSTVRGWHNLPATNPAFNNKLCVIIGHSDTPTRWIQDINRSPFNVGTSITVENFEMAEIEELNRRYGSPIVDKRDLRWLLDFLGGHPRLTRLALDTVATRRCSCPELVRLLDHPNGPFLEHLRGVLLTLNKMPEIRESFRQILLGRSCQDEIHYQCLWAIGLITGNTRMEARPRCRLYQQYLEQHL